MSPELVAILVALGTAVGGVAVKALASGLVRALRRDLEEARAAVLHLERRNYVLARELEQHGITPPPPAPREPSSLEDIP